MNLLDIDRVILVAWHKYLVAQWRRAGNVAALPSMQTKLSRDIGRCLQ